MTTLREMNMRVGDTVFLSTALESEWGPLVAKKVTRVNQFCWFVEEGGKEICFSGYTEGMCSSNAAHRVFLDNPPPQLSLDLCGDLAELRRLHRDNSRTRYDHYRIQSQVK